MLAVLTLLVGLALPVWAVFLLLRRGKHQLDAAITYRTVAGELGLAVDTRGVSVHGHLGNHRLWVGEVMVGHGADRRTAIWGVLDLERPLGLGLQVRRRGLSERVFRRGRAPGVELGDDFDRRVEIRGDSAPRVRALIGDRHVKRELGSLMARWPDVVVTDTSVRVHLSRHEVREDRLMALVAGMRALSKALAEARQTVAAPEQLQPLVGSWAVLADEVDLKLEPWLPALSGTYGGRACVVAANRVDRGYLADLTLTLGPHKELGLRVGRQTAPDGYWSVGQDIQLDDPAFDDAFVVKGWDPGKIRDLLDSEVRAHILALSTLGHPNLEDHQLVVTGIDCDPAALAQVLARATQLADALGW